MRRAPTFDFPPWLWCLFGVAIVAISLPLAVQQAVHDELVFACTAGRRSTLPLAFRQWFTTSGALVPVSVTGWLAVAASGVLLCRARWRRFAPAAGIAGFSAVVCALWFACRSAGA